MVLFDKDITFWLPDTDDYAGGNISTNRVVDNVLHNLYPTLPEEKAVEGVTAECRLIFIKNESDTTKSGKIITWIENNSNNPKCKAFFGIGAAGANAAEIRLPTPYMLPPNVQFYDFASKPTVPQIVKLEPKQYIGIWFNLTTQPETPSTSEPVTFKFSVDVERVPEIDPGTDIQCPAGQILDPTTGQCVPFQFCPDGWIYNPVTRQCMLDPDDPGNQPPPDPDCPSGQHKNAQGICVPDDPDPDPDPDDPCPAGQHRDSAGNCVPDVVNPPPTGTIPNRRFGAAGDWDCNSRTDQSFAVMKQYLTTSTTNPQTTPLGWVLALGDMSYGSTQSCWISKAQSNLGQIFPTLVKCIIGNHDDTEDGSAQKRADIINRFGMPLEGYYAFTVENIRFIMLDTQKPVGVGSAQYNFCVQQLQAAQSDPNIDWKFVCYHKPSVTSKGNDHGALSSMFVYHPLFDQYGVDFVLAGHNHNSEVTKMCKFTSGNSTPIPVNEGTMVGSIHVYQGGTKGTIFMVLGGAGRSADTTDADDNYMQHVEQDYAVGIFDLLNNGQTMKFNLINDASKTTRYTLEVRK